MDAITKYFIVLITNLATMPTLVIMLVQLFKKYRASVDPDTGKHDPVRLLVLLQILFWFTSVLYPTIYRLVELEDPGSMFTSLNLASLFVAFMIAAGVSLLSFVHHKESWMYAAWFFYLGIVIYSLFTGLEFTFFSWQFSLSPGMGNTAGTFFVLQFIFVLVGQMALDIFYFITGKKYKDDKIFGLGIFFLMPIISGMASENPFVYMICYGFLAIYGIPYATGKIKFFKAKPAVPVIAAEVRE
ncbi:MAG: hypothetical protein GYA24_25700 [Candidatus Lokiarchaeota archaeon]|nr:hypothetical protein [Candidatus Lokiarchaeota archaeon]